MKRSILSMIIPLYISLIQINNIYGKCSFVQLCNKKGDPKCVPMPTTGEYAEYEEITDIADNPYCPEYSNKKGCCRPASIEALQDNLQSLETIFGSSAGGCDICVVNLKRFWCHFTCHPDQAKYLKMIGFRNHTFGNDTKLLLDMNWYLDDQMMCDMFKSCKKTKFAAQVPAMGNAMGFLNFQGVNAYTKMPVYIYVKSARHVEGQGLYFDCDPCDTAVPSNHTFRKYHVPENCTCNACMEKCDYSLISTTPVLEGLSGKTVGIFYGVVAGLTVIITLARNFWCTKKK